MNVTVTLAVGGGAGKGWQSGCTPCAGNAYLLRQVTLHLKVHPELVRPRRARAIRAPHPRGKAGLLPSGHGNVLAVLAERVGLLHRAELR